MKTGSESIEADHVQEAPSVRGICGAHGGYETAKVCDVWRTAGGRGLRRGPGKRVNGVSPGRPQSFRYYRRPVDDCSPGRGGMSQDGRTMGRTFVAKWIAAEKVKAGIRHALVCPDVTGRAKERIAQSRRVRAGSLAVTD